MNDRKQPPAGESRLAARLAAGRFVLTAEVTPPVSFDAADLMAKAEPLRGLADAVNVTDGAGAHAHLAVGTAAAILVRHGIEPILQLTCRDRNRIALQSEMIAAAANGVSNLLMLAGDKPSAGDQPDATPVFDLDSLGLIETAQRLNDPGELPTGRKVAGRAAFFIGAADMPIDPPAGWKPDGLRRKIAAGARFAQTQFCMDAGVVRRYAARLVDEGVLPGLKMLIGVAPLRSMRSIQWMRAHLYGAVIADAIAARMATAADPSAEGIKICAELAEEFAAIPGIAGVHVMAPNNEAALAETLAAARTRIGAG